MRSRFDPETLCRWGCPVRFTDKTITFFQSSAAYHFFILHAKMTYMLLKILAVFLWCVSTACASPLVPLDSSQALIPTNYSSTLSLPEVDSSTGFQTDSDSNRGHIIDRVFEEMYKTRSIFTLPMGFKPQFTPEDFGRFIKAARLAAIQRDPDLPLYKDHNDPYRFTVRTPEGLPRDFYLEMKSVGDTMKDAFTWRKLRSMLRALAYEVKTRKRTAAMTIELWDAKTERSTDDILIAKGFLRPVQDSNNITIV